MTTSTSLKPTGLRVLVEFAKTAEVKAGDIYLGSQPTANANREGVVKALGSGRNEQGKKIGFDVKVGDRVLLPAFVSMAMEVGDVDCALVTEDEILGVLE